MTQLKLQFAINALAYLWGGCLGMVLRYAAWLKKQPVGAGLRTWLEVRMASNLTAGALLLTGMLIWLEGGLTVWLNRWLSTDPERPVVIVTMGFSVLVGCAITFFSHKIVARGRRESSRIDEGDDTDG